MKIKSSGNNTNLANALFLSGWIIFIVSYILLHQTELVYMADVSLIYRATRTIAIILFLIKIVIVNKYNPKKLLCYFVILSILLINAIFIKNYTVLFTILIALASDNINYDKFIKKDLLIRTILLIIIVGLSLIGVLPNFTRFINGSLKQGLGFLHPNTLCLFAITILLELLYITKKINLKYLSLNILAIFLLTLLCFSRTSILAFIFVFTANIVIRNKEKFFRNTFIKKLLCLLPILLTIFSLLVVIGYSNNDEMRIKLDRALTGRIESGHSFYEEYGVNLFGHEIETIGTRTALQTGQQTSIFDMGYLRLLIEYGLITSTTVIVLLCLSQKNALNTRNYKLLLLSTFFILIGFAENSIYNIAMNFTLIYLPYIFNKNNNIKIGGQGYEQS